MINAEKSEETVKKYLREAEKFARFLDGREVSKSLCMEYKQSLIREGRASSGINAALSGVRALLKLMKRDDISLKNLKIQRRVYVSKKKVLDKRDYKKLIKGARDAEDKKLALILETMAATGIRVSELKYFTVESLRTGEINIRLKGKTRNIAVTGKLRRKLEKYCMNQGITEGVVFKNKKGAPLHRSQIWQKMKKVCAIAKVEKTKVFPHNLRKLFARTFYKIKNDIVKLADLLGHTSINTTRIYLADSIDEHLKALDKMGLVT